MTQWRATWLGVSLAVMSVAALGLASCDDVDPVGAYCSLHNYCYPDTDFNDCMQTQESEEDLARAQGEQCHDAFLAFNQCIAELSCMDLDAYYATSEHCGTLYNTWQNRCSN